MRTCYSIGLILLSELREEIQHLILVTTYFDGAQREHDLRTSKFGLRHSVNSPKDSGVNFITMRVLYFLLPVFSTMEVRVMPSNIYRKEQGVLNSDYILFY